ncbi:7,8-dihydro-8-oxoguanine triphosphatase NUDT15 [Aspergillus sclerotiicarbonarius CBS 121057]|uniref:7,8-dihydro-8-oxoguanine triphosphatase NUDT15 n=1 Tax=Aspergillus sclerotiicarbonarius (strain CBS 121057 / IBT 28362) TaxID=1448318 RepID=A0A319ERJ4_ASPSB|nr:7,8-dihydro-8-oxoguanine triphosphatase NUDT15 [Aspergillus sclerotiicarbonarius CBS 121057]
MSPPTTIGVAVAVYVFNKHGQTILGQRQGSLGAGTWGHPGGHLEPNETFETCAAREVLEETGLQVTDIRFLTAINNIMPEAGKHYVTVFVGCRLLDEGVGPVVMEPEKCVRWEWVTWGEMKSAIERQTEAERTGKMDGFEGRVLFKPILKLLEQRKGFDPLEVYEGVRG